MTQVTEAGVPARGAAVRDETREQLDDPEAVAEMDVPDHETVVEAPRGLLRFVPPEA